MKMSVKLDIDLCKFFMLLWKPIIIMKERKMILIFPTINVLYCR